MDDENQEVLKRQAYLLAELNKGIRHANLRARIDHWFSILSMSVALTASGFAGIGGLTEYLTLQQTSIIALLPGIIAVIATTLKFEGKSAWHYQMVHRLEDFRDQLMVQTSNPPTFKEIAALSKKRNGFIKEMADEWVRDFSLNWTVVQKRIPETHEARALDLDRRD